MKNLLKITLTFLLIAIIVLGFAVPVNMVGNWYQQFLPNLNGALIRDIVFTDSLNGHIVTSIGGSNSHILKTTNGGDNWGIKFSHNQPFVKVKFISTNTGFTNAFQTIYKTTNAGENWTPINLPGIFGDDMFVLNEDTIWLAMSESLTGGVFRTTNGGASWQQQLSIGSANPNHIYMINARIGFIAEDAGYLRKTSNSGVNWTLLTGVDGFYDMCFADTLTGWKCVPGDSSVRKTTNGGNNWTVQILPKGAPFVSSQVQDFSLLNKDTLWGVGGVVNMGGLRGVIYRTTNGGNNWLYQIPDNIFGYAFVQFVNRNNGWAYYNGTGVHTTNGGDTTWLTPIQQISSEVPKDFMLYQNYPNPFNPVTNIKYQITNRKFVNLMIYDITGKHIIDLVNREQSAGTYQVDFSGTGYSSGVYFYALIVNGLLSDVKKMILLK